MKRDDIIEVEIESIGAEGVSVARHDGLVVFVQGALPGEKVQAKIRKKKKSFAQASLVSILEASPEREEPRCNFFGECGGCSWQNYSYQGQVAWKQQTVVDAFERIGKIPYGELRTLVASPQIFNYRNKMEFSFANRRWLMQREIESGKEFDRDFALGLHVPGRFDGVLDIDVCHIQHEVGNKVTSLIRENAKRFGVTAHNERTHEGFLRHCMIRRTNATNELMVVVITKSPNVDAEHEFLAWLEQHFVASIPECTTLLHAVNDTHSPVANGIPRILFGNGYITEHSHGVDFRISPFSFFQTNSFQLSNFLDATYAAAQIKPTDMVWDLYCGTGSITLPAAKNAKHVIGIELVESSIIDAKANAQRNGISNVDFTCADLHKPATIEFLSTLPQPDVLIVDPPRAGIHEQTLRHILEVAPPTVAYVSCNPATQARDCAILDEKYAIEYMQPLDMFPHTFHVENVARLVRR